MLAVLASSSVEGASKSDDVIDAVHGFLSAYADGDERTVLSFVTAGQPHIYGSDAAEAIDSRAAFAEMLRADHRLWNSPVSFGPLQRVSEERSGDLASVFFDAGFRLRGNEVPLRFAMVWRREKGAWKLLQSSNVVPTTNQSATALLNHPTKEP